MTNNELRKLNRAELLEMLLEISKENEELRSRLEEAENKLTEKEINIAACGSIAEAALALNGVFEAADAACEQMKESTRRRLLEIESRKMRAKISAVTIIAEAEYKAAEILEEAKRKAQEYEKNLSFEEQLDEEFEEE